MSSVFYQNLGNGSLGINSTLLRAWDRVTPSLLSFSFFVWRVFLSPLISKGKYVSLYSIRINDNCTPISHILFAYACYIFYMVHMKKIDTIISCLNKLNQAFGQTTNLDKKNNFLVEILLESLEDLSKMLLILNILLLKKIISVCLLVLGKTNWTFFFFIEEIARINKVPWWKLKLLSQASKKFLLKSGVIVIPSYAMSCFPILEKIYNSYNII